MCSDKSVPSLACEGISMKVSASTAAHGFFMLNIWFLLVFGFGDHRRGPQIIGSRTERDLPGTPVGRRMTRQWPWQVLRSGAWNSVEQGEHPGDLESPCPAGIATRHETKLLTEENSMAIWVRDESDPLYRLRTARPLTKCGILPSPKIGRRRSCSEADDAAPQRKRDRLGPIVHTEFLEQRFHVALHGFLGAPPQPELWLAEVVDGDRGDSETRKRARMSALLRTEIVRAKSCKRSRRSYPACFVAAG